MPDFDGVDNHLARLEGREPSIETREYTLPAYWASYLINGDASGLEGTEQSECDEWLESENPGYCVDCNGEPKFAHSNDANSRGGDVATFTFIKE